MTNPRFEILVERYFAGDLDPVERRALDLRIQNDPEAREAFDEAWDQRTEAFGLMALESSEAVLSECFSDRTLLLYARGRLDPEERSMVEAHLECDYCRLRLPALPQTAAVLEFQQSTASAEGPNSGEAERDLGRMRPRSQAEELSSSDARPKLSRFGWIAGLMAASLILGVSVVRLENSPSPLQRLAEASPTILVHVQKGAKRVRRGREYHPGDRVVLAVGGLPEGLRGNLRIYLEGVGLKASCPGDPQCHLQEGGFRFARVLDARGRWTAAWFLSTGPLPPSTGDLEKDLSAADDLSTRTETRTWEVR